MPVVELTVADFAAWDVPNEDKLSEMITDVLAQAVTLAPCLVDETFVYVDAARAVLREAVLRRLDAGTGAVVTRAEGTGPFQRSETVDNRTRRVILQPGDISELQRLCALHTGERSGGRAGQVNLDPNSTSHDPFATRPDLWFQWNTPHPVEGVEP